MSELRRYSVQKFPTGLGLDPACRVTTRLERDRTQSAYLNMIKTTFGFAARSRREGPMYIVQTQAGYRRRRSRRRGGPPVDFEFGGANHSQRVRGESFLKRRQLSSCQRAWVFAVGFCCWKLVTFPFYILQLRENGGTQFRSFLFFLNSVLYILVFLGVYIIPKWLNNDS